LTLDTMNSLANLLSYASRYEEAFSVYETVIYGYEKSLGCEHVDTLAAVNNYGMLLHNSGHANKEKAIELVRRASEGWIAQLGMQHSLSCTSLYNLAAIIMEYDLSEAERLSRMALLGRETSLGPDHTMTANSLTQLSNILNSRGELEESIQLCRRAVSIFEHRLGKEHPNYLNGCIALADRLQRAGDFAEAGNWMDASLLGYERLIDARRFLTFKRSLMNARAEFEPDTAVKQLEDVLHRLTILCADDAEQDADIIAVRQDLEKFRACATLAEQAELSKHTLPMQIKVDAHIHTLQLLHNKSGGRRLYNCDICHELGQGLVYFCEECKTFDAHPQCYPKLEDSRK
jgi:tetratricopeptide (TPR) repeat protein